MINLIMGRKVIFSDIDYTLVITGETPSSKLIEAIKLCNRHNIEFVLISGRPTKNIIDFAKLLIKEEAIINYIMGFNGAELYDLNTDKYIYQNLLTKSEVETITNVAKAHNLEYLLYSKDEIIYSKLTANIELYIKLATGYKKSSKFSTVIESPKVLIVTEDNKAAKTLDLIKLDLNNFTTAVSSHKFIEVNQRYVNKGFAVNHALKYLDIKLEDALCVGDSGNDYYMISSDMTSIAMGNADKEIKDAADLIIGTVSEDGLANYIIDCLS